MNAKIVGRSLLLAALALLMVGLPAQTEAKPFGRIEILPTGDKISEGYLTGWSHNSTIRNSTAIDTISGKIGTLYGRSTSVSFSIAGAEAIAFGVTTTDISNQDGWELRYQCSTGDSTAWTALTQALSSTTAGQDTAVTLGTIPNYRTMRVEMRSVNGGAADRFSFKVHAYVLYGR